MKHIPAFHRRLMGFTLVELAVVLAIIGLLLGGLLVPLSTQIEQGRINDTRKAMDDIKEALIGFALANGRLPCPADPAVPTGTAGAGTEKRSAGKCVNDGGVLPWATLGLSETDAWGRRYTYRVTDNFAQDPTPPAQSCFFLPDKGDLDVKDGGSTIASNLPAVIVSHGKNGYGAYLPDGSQISGASGDELENADNDDDFVSRTPGPDFDDLVAWVPLPILKSRMVAAGKLP